MAEMYEAALAIYLTRCGHVFIAPQYIIDWNDELREGGSVPDFVALDFSEKHVVVVEITTRANVAPLVRKLKARNKDWYQPIVRSLMTLTAINDAWKIRSLGFVRKEFVAKATEVMPDGDVTFCPLEEAVHSWDYWPTRRNGRLPGADRFADLPSLNCLQV